MEPLRQTSALNAQLAWAPKPGAAARCRLEGDDPRADGRRRVVLLGRDQIVIARSVAGVFMQIALKPAAFRGVALRLSPADDGGFRYEIRLAHSDPDLCVTLVELSDDSEIQAEWRLWARFLGLPTLVEREEGVEAPESARLGAVRVHGARPRRRGKTMLSRRARFLVRRKVGRPDLCVARDGAAHEMFSGSKRER